MLKDKVELPIVNVITGGSTGSAIRLKQVIGRGLRMCEEKTYCLVLAFAEDIERHHPDGDVFAPSIKDRLRKALGRFF